jgi:hypothetical protein
LDVKVCDLPRDSHIVFAIHEDPLFEGGGGGGGDATSGGNCGRPLFWTSCSLFTSNATLRTGTLLLPLRKGAWPGSATTIGASNDDLSGSNEGVIEIDLGSVGIPPGTVAIDCDLTRNAWAHWKSLTQTYLSSLQASIGSNTAASRSATNFFRSVSSAYVESLVSLTGGVGNSGGGAPFVDELFLGKNARGMNGRSSSPLPPTASLSSLLTTTTSQSAAAASNALFNAGAIGSDSRGLEPLRVPSLQSATPNINAQLQQQQQQQMRNQSLSSSASALNNAVSSSRISKGVDSLSQSDLTLVRLLKGNIYACDAFWPQRLSQSLRTLLWHYRKSLVLQSQSSSSSMNNASSSVYSKNAFFTLGMQACLPIVLKSCPSLYSTSATDSNNSIAYADAPSSFLYGNSDASLPGKAATHAAQLLIRQASLQYNGGKLHPFVCLQLLDSSFTDPTIRSLAIESFVSHFLPLTSSLHSSIPHLSPFNYLFPISLISVCESTLNSVTSRALLTMAVEEPLTIGRQLGWSYLSLFTATGLRSRASRLVRAITDVTDEYFTAEFALQNFALTQIATACRRATLSASRGTRTAVLRKALEGIVLPPVVRLPLRAHEQIIPSIFYKSLNNGSLQTMFTSLIKKEVDDHLNARNGKVMTTTTTSETINTIISTSPKSLIEEDHYDGSIKRNSIDVDSDTDIEDDDEDDDNDNDNEENDINLDDEINRVTSTSSSNPLFTAASVEKTTTSESVLKFAQQIDDSVSLSLSTLGVFSDAAAFRLSSIDFRNPLRAYKALTIAADEATVDFRRNVGLLKPGAKSVRELDPRLPLSGFGIRSSTTSYAMDTTTGSIKPSLTYGAIILSAAKQAAIDEIEFLDADTRRKMENILREERQANADVEKLLDTYRTSIGEGGEASQVGASVMPITSSLPPHQHLPSSSSSSL